MAGKYSFKWKKSLKFFIENPPKKDTNAIVFPKKDTILPI